MPSYIFIAVEPVTFDMYLFSVLITTMLRANIKDSVFQGKQFG